MSQTAGKGQQSESEVHIFHCATANHTAMSMVPHPNHITTATPAVSTFHRPSSVYNINAASAKPAATSGMTKSSRKVHVPNGKCPRSGSIPQQDWQNRMRIKTKRHPHVLNEAGVQAAITTSCTVQTCKRPANTSNGMVATYNNATCGVCYSAGDSHM